METIRFKDPKNPATEVVLFNGSIDDLFLAMQPDDKARHQAADWIMRYPIKKAKDE